MKQLLLTSLALTVLFTAGCQVVNVTDKQGKPIAWADVSVTAQDGSSAGLPVKTDLMGNATLPMSQQAPGSREWLEVRKEGYHPGRVIRPEDGHVVVELMKIPSAMKK